MLKPKSRRCGAPVKGKPGYVCKRLIVISSPDRYCWQHSKTERAAESEGEIQKNPEGEEDESRAKEEKKDKSPKLPLPTESEIKEAEALGKEYVAISEEFQNRVKFKEASIELLLSYLLQIYNPERRKNKNF